MVWTDDKEGLPTNIHYMTWTNLGFFGYRVSGFDGIYHGLRAISRMKARAKEGEEEAICFSSCTVSDSLLGAVA